MGQVLSARHGARPCHHVNNRARLLSTAQKGCTDLKGEPCKAFWMLLSKILWLSGVRTLRPAVPNRNRGVSSHCFLGTTSSAQPSRGCNAFFQRPVQAGSGFTVIMLTHDDANNSDQ